MPRFRYRELFRQGSSSSRGGRRGQGMAARQREEVAEVVFESLGAPALAQVASPLLTLLAQARTTGVVVDLGGDVASCAPVWRGRLVEGALTRRALAGNQLSQHMASILASDPGFGLSSPVPGWEEAAAEDLKEKHAYVCEDFQEELRGSESRRALLAAASLHPTRTPASSRELLDLRRSTGGGKTPWSGHQGGAGRSGSGSAVSYQLPDGQVIRCWRELFECPEVLFQPRLMQRHLAAKTKRAGGGGGPNHHHHYQNIHNNHNNTRPLSSWASSSSVSTPSTLLYPHGALGHHSQYPLSHSSHHPLHHHHHHHHHHHAPSPDSPIIHERLDQGVHQFVRESIAEVHPTMQAPLAGSLVLAGGSSMFPGFASRLQRELQKLSPTSWKVKVHKGGLAQRQFRAWMGGALIASLPSFPELCTSREQYQEVGPHAVHRAKLHSRIPQQVFSQLVSVFEAQQVRNHHDYFTTPHHSDGGSTPTFSCSSSIPSPLLHLGPPPSYSSYSSSSTNAYPHLRTPMRSGRVDDVDDPVSPNPNLGSRTADTPSFNPMTVIPVLPGERGSAAKDSYCGSRRDKDSSYPGPPESHSSFSSSVLYPRTSVWDSTTGTPHGSPQGGSTSGFMDARHQHSRQAGGKSSTQEGSSGNTSTHSSIRPRDLTSLMMSPALSIPASSPDGGSAVGRGGGSGDRGGGSGGGGMRRGEPFDMESFGGGDDGSEGTFCRRTREEVARLTASCPDFPGRSGTGVGTGMVTGVDVSGWDSEGVLLAAPRHSMEVKATCVQEATQREVTRMGDEALSQWYANEEVIARLSALLEPNDTPRMSFDEAQQARKGFPPEVVVRSEDRGMRDENRAVEMCGGGDINGRGGFRPESFGSQLAMVSNESSCEIHLRKGAGTEDAILEVSETPTKRVIHYECDDREALLVQHLSPRAQSDGKVSSKAPSRYLKSHEGPGRFGTNHYSTSRGRDPQQSSIPAISEGSAETKTKSSLKVSLVDSMLHAERKTFSPDDDDDENDEDHFLKSAPVTPSSSRSGENFQPGDDNFRKISVERIDEEEDLPERTFEDDSRAVALPGTSLSQTSESSLVFRRALDHLKLVTESAYGLHLSDGTKAEGASVSRMIESGTASEVRPPVHEKQYTYIREWGTESEPRNRSVGLTPVESSDSVDQLQPSISQESDRGSESKKSAPSPLRSESELCECASPEVATNSESLQHESCTVANHVPSSVILSQKQCASQLYNVMSLEHWHTTKSSTGRQPKKEPIVPESLTKVRKDLFSEPLSEMYPSDSGDEDSRAVDNIDLFDKAFETDVAKRMKELTALEKKSFHNSSHQSWDTSPVTAAESSSSGRYGNNEKVLKKSRRTPTDSVNSSMEISRFGDLSPNGSNEGVAKAEYLKRTDSFGVDGNGETDFLGTRVKDFDSPISDKSAGIKKNERGECRLSVAHPQESSNEIVADSARDSKDELKCRLENLEVGLILKQVAGLGKRLEHLGASPLAHTACSVIQQELCSHWHDTTDMLEQ